MIRMEDIRGAYPAGATPEAFRIGMHEMRALCAGRGISTHGAAGGSYAAAGFFVSGIATLNSIPTATTATAPITLCQRKLISFISMLT